MATSDVRIESANWHLTDRCNYSCTFCFVKNLPGEEVDLELGRNIIGTLDRAGISKVNFVGGEPFLHPHVSDFAACAKGRGMTTSVVTNGSLLNRDRVLELQKHFDWVGVSIDSTSEDTEAALGRGRGQHVEHAKLVCGAIRAAGIRLKVNTVVTKLNFREDMRSLISELKPHRWKVFQMLPIAGQNDSCFPSLATSKQEFREFEETNRELALESGQHPVFESGEDMVDCYLMLGPDGRIFQNVGHQYSYLPFDAALSAGLSGVVDVGAYVNRGGGYDWQTEPRLAPNRAHA